MNAKFLPQWGAANPTGNRHLPGNTRDQAAFEQRSGAQMLIAGALLATLLVAATANSYTSMWGVRAVPTSLDVSSPALAAAAQFSVASSQAAPEVAQAPVVRIRFERTYISMRYHAAYQPGCCERYLHYRRYEADYPYYGYYATK